MRALPFQQLHGPRAMVKRKGLFFDLRLELKCSPIGCRKADSYLVVESIFVRVAIRGRCKTRHQRDLRELMLLARSRPQRRFHSALRRQPMRERPRSRSLQQLERLIQIRLAGAVCSFEDTQTLYRK